MLVQAAAPLVANGVQPARQQPEQRKANGATKQPSALVRAACLDPGTGVWLSILGEMHANHCGCNYTLDFTSPGSSANLELASQSKHIQACIHGNCLFVLILL